MALSIAPSKHWMGNDGPWSTFSIKVGAQAELLEVLPASSLSLTLVVLPEGCTQNEQQQANCRSSRGNILDTGNLVGWNPLQAANGYPFLNISLPGVQALLTENVTSQIGVNTLGLPWLGMNSTQNAIPLENQLIAGYATKSPFLGLLGLSGWPSYPATADEFYNSTLQTLKNRSSISGLTWAYTAGAKYTTPESYGSLTFGGYDSSLVNMDQALNGVTFTRGFNGNELTLTVKAIRVGEKASDAIGTGMVAQLDSMFPDIYLPEEICALFVDAFGLQWNESASMYLVTDEQHVRLQTENTSVAFDLSSDSDPEKLVTITLPYASFYHEVKFPLANITNDEAVLHYFPLKPKPNTTTNFDIFLGRTFFQEAYVSVDYERETFNIGQALFPRTQDRNIVTVYPVANTPSPKPSLTAGAIAGIAVGAVVLLSLLAALAWYLRRRRRNQLLRKAADIRTTRTASVDEITLATLDPDPSTIRNEYYKPPQELATPTGSAWPPSDSFRKHELDANSTATNPQGQQLERHELSAGSVHYDNSSRPGPGHRRDLSFGSSVSGISPMGVGVGERLSDAFGEPSPPLALSSGSPSPPLSDIRRSGSVFSPFEMP